MSCDMVDKMANECEEGISGYFSTASQKRVRTSILSDESSSTSPISKFAKVFTSMRALCQKKLL